MKAITLFLTIFILAFPAFGQKKPVRRKTVPPPPTKTVGLYEMPRVTTPVPTRKVAVKKKNGEWVRGRLIGADDKIMAIQVENTKVNLELDEVDLVLFGEEIAFSGSPAVPPREGIATRRDGEPARGANTISGGVMNGKAVSLPKPEYPAAARAVRAAGAVNVQVTIDEEGNVINAAAVSGHPLLRQVAEQSARQAKFSPIILSGQPVKVVGIIVYNFVP